ncbi:protein ATP6V1FNB [Frankliniella occidentalis]|uniref:Protein ATP6V1FNB n=1 Tax=Frankliniella occidentalis TaxID=133901 RepID=A0A6J1TE93_FRAOC|nr:protein ATP6V1FNB [Frankliniella occidentalis]
MSGSKSSKFNFNDALFFAEVYNREFLTRLHWFEKNYKRVYEGKPAESVPRKAAVLYDELVRRRLHDQKHAPRFVVRHSLPPIPKPDNSVELLPPMRPVSESERAQLKEGSEAFLKARYRASPDERYYYPLTSSWDYGWLVEHMPLTSVDMKIHARKNIIKETFLRRNGVHPELSHYRHTTSHNRDFPFI